MTSCWACETELSAEWKYCIMCGVPVGADGDEGSGRERSLGLLPLFGIILGSIVVVLVAAFIVVALVAQ
jgi:hypothetical protein